MTLVLLHSVRCVCVIGIVLYNILFAITMHIVDYIEPNGYLMWTCADFLSSRRRSIWKVWKIK